MTGSEKPILSEQDLRDTLIRVFDEETSWPYRMTARVTWTNIERRAVRVGFDNGQVFLVHVQGTDKKGQRKEKDMVIQVKLSLAKNRNEFAAVDNLEVTTQDANKLSVNCYQYGQQNLYVEHRT